MKRPLLFLILILTHSLTTSANECLDLFRWPSTAENSSHAHREITIWRYGGLGPVYDFDKFRAATVTVWREQQGFYQLDALGLGSPTRFYPMGSTLENSFFQAAEGVRNPLSSLEDDDSNYLVKNQDFAVQIQLRSGVPHDIVDEQLQLVQGLQAEQITFFESRGPSGQDGTVMLISGQDSYGNPLPMPFENNKMENYDRASYRFGWELGRGSTLTPQAYIDLLRAAAYVAYKELLVLGGSLDEAFVFVHSATPQHTRLYISVYKMKILSPTKKTGETVLIAPLKTLLDRSSPDYFLPAAQALRRANSTLTNLDAFTSFQKYLENVNQFLENRYGSLLTVRDFSPLAAQLTLGSLSGTLPTSVTPHFRDDDYVFRDHAYRSHSRNKDISLRAFLASHRAIELEINPDRRDPRSGAELVQIAISHVFNQIRALGVEFPIDNLRDQKIQLAITFHDEATDLVRDLPRTWRTIDSWLFHAYPEIHETVTDGVISQERFSSKHIVSLIFDLRTVIEGMDSNPQDPFFRGDFHRRMHLYFPSLYTADSVENRTEETWPTNWVLQRSVR